MGSVQLLQISQLKCSSLGQRQWSFSSLGPRQRSIRLTSPLQIQRRNLFFCAGAQKDNRSNFSPPEDISYLGKLALGCIAGGIVIKYGSIFLPSITRPNLVEALFMIGFPVLISILLLLRASSMQKPQSWCSFWAKYGRVQNTPENWDFFVYFHRSFRFFLFSSKGCWKGSLYQQQRMLYWKYQCEWLLYFSTMLQKHDQRPNFH